MTLKTIVVKMEGKSLPKQQFVDTLNFNSFYKYDVLSEYVPLFIFATLLNEYELEVVFRKISHCYERNKCAKLTLPPL